MKLLNVGERYGRWTVIGVEPVIKNGSCYYLCRCDCGTVKLQMASKLRTGRSKSCGCLRRKSENESGSRLYRIWRGMKSRCLNANSPVFKYYGGRGITVCDEWVDSYMAFRNWALKNGYTEVLTIDRIDVNGNYEPANCRWTDWKTQRSNTRRNIYLTLDGETMTLAEWADKLGVSSSTLHTRYMNGWTDEAILTTPIDKRYSEDVIRFTMNGEAKTLNEWADVTGIPRNTLYARFYKGNSDEEILTKNKYRYLTLDGKTKTVAEWSRETGISDATLRSRINAGWTDEAILTTPVRLRAR